MRIPRAVLSRYSHFHRWKVKWLSTEMPKSLILLQNSKKVNIQGLNWDSCRNDSCNYYSHSYINGDLWWNISQCFDFCLSELRPCCCNFDCNIILKHFDKTRSAVELIKPFPQMKSEMTVDRNAQILNFISKFWKVNIQGLVRDSCRDDSYNSYNHIYNKDVLWRKCSQWFRFASGS